MINYAKNEVKKLIKKRAALDEEIYKLDASITAEQGRRVSCSIGVDCEAKAEKLAGIIRSEFKEFGFCAEVNRHCGEDEEADMERIVVDVWCDAIEKLAQAHFSEMITDFIKAIPGVK